MNQRTRLWVRTTGCVGRLPPHGEVWKKIQHSLTLQSCLCLGLSACSLCSELQLSHSFVGVSVSACLSRFSEQ